MWAHDDVSGGPGQVGPIMMWAGIPFLRKNDVIISGTLKAFLWWAGLQFPMFFYDAGPTVIGIDDT